MLYGMTNTDELLRRTDEWAAYRTELSRMEAADNGLTVDWSDCEDEGAALVHELAEALRTALQAAQCPCFVLSEDGWCRLCGKQWKAVG